MTDLSKILSKEQRKTIVNAILTPFSWIYGMGVWLRNTAFNLKLLKQHTFEVPVVSVGNIAVGGTGKTPHVEYIVAELCRKYHIGVLSRGYKRRTKGFIMARETLGPKDLGDEPYQIYRKFMGLISLAVCESRVKGIREMLKLDPNINLIVLDDAFQHRYVVPKVNILLVDFNRQPHDDKLLPLGTLREPMRYILKADMVVVTKCPSNISQLDLRLCKENLGLFPAQDLFFSRINYSKPVPVFPIADVELTDLNQLGPEDLIMGLTGIANQRPFVKYLRSFRAQVKVIHYDDHHDYTREDFRYILRVFGDLKGKRKYIVTTEKDAVRILNNPYFPMEMRGKIFFIPIKVAFNMSGKVFIEELDKKIQLPLTTTR